MSRALLLTVVLLLAGQAWASTAEEKENRARLEALKDEIAELNGQLFSRRSEVDKQAEILKGQEVELAAIRSKINRIDGEIANLQTELADLTQRKQELEASRKAQQELIARELTAAHREGNSEVVKLLLNQEDPHKIARTLKYYRYFADARREKIDSFTRIIEELVAVEEGIGLREAQLLENRSAQEAAAVSLMQEQQRRKETLVTLENLLNSDQSRLDKLNSERDGLEKLIVRLEEALLGLGKEESVPFHKRKGKMPWPVAGKLSKAYGSTRAQNLKWTGWLIDAREGDPVVAVHNGRVVFSDYLRGQGLMIIIDHGDGFLSLYAHNQVLLKDVGDWVQPGDRLALAGNTGGLENSALYFEIRHNGKPKDPVNWLARR